MQPTMTRSATRALAAAGAFAAVAVFAATAQAADANLPKTMIWTAYGTTSSGYAQSVAIGNMLKNKFGTSVRVLPGKNDVSRMTPLKAGKADYCACGIASYYGQEGIFLFAKKGWGPQPIRVLMTSIGSFGLGVLTAKDIGAKTYADLKGKRVAWVRAGDALNVGTTAYLAFAGLTWKDVKKVEFGGFKASMNGILNNQVDAAFASTVTPSAKQIAASPRGIAWPTMAPGDKAGWQRLAKVAPYFQQHVATVGAEITKQKPWEGASYAYPILVTNASHGADTVYALTKAMVSGYNDYKDGAPGAKGWALKNQNFTWVIPYHTGAVKYFKEVGVWTAAHEAHNNNLVKRQSVLAGAWKAFLAKNPSDDGFKANWMKARAAALTKAGMDPVFK